MKNLVFKLEKSLKWTDYDLAREINSSKIYEKAYDKPFDKLLKSIFTKSTEKILMDLILKKIERLESIKKINWYYRICAKNFNNWDFKRKNKRNNGSDKNRIRYWPYGDSYY